MFSYTAAPTSDAHSHVRSSRSLKKPQKKQKPLDLCQAEKRCSFKHGRLLSAEQNIVIWQNGNNRSLQGGKLLAPSSTVIEVLKGTNKMSRTSIEGSGWDGSNWVLREKERCGREWKWQGRELSYFFFPTGIDSLVSGMSRDPAVRRLQNYWKLSVQDWPPKSNLLPASVIL